MIGTTREAQCPPLEIVAKHIDAHRGDDLHDLVLLT